MGSRVRLETRRPHGGVQALHHLAREEGGHHIRLRLLPTVVQKGGQRVVVQPVLGHGIAHHEELPAHLVLHLQRLLGGGEGPRLQAADGLGANGFLFADIHGKAAALGPQGPPGGGHADPLQVNAQTFLQAVRHRPGQTAHLVDVVDLPVQHRTAPVLRHFDVQGLKPTPGGSAHNAHDAAGSDIQGENQVPLLGS